MTIASNMSKDLIEQIVDKRNKIKCNFHSFFRYELGNGNKFRGTTAFVMEKIEPNMKMKLFYNLLLDANKQTYWVTFTETEINSSECIVKTVNPGSLFI